jgi:hypothetical protein
MPDAGYQMSDKSWQNGFTGIRDLGSGINDFQQGGLKCLN